MPVHDWTRVQAGTFHHFHTAWMTHLSETLNGGLLPAGYYAMSEQIAGDVGPDVLTLEAIEPARPPADRSGSPRTGMTAVAESPPEVSFTATAETASYASKRRTLVIRHSSGDRIVALIEIVSPGNKNKRAALNAFIDKALAALRHGQHLLIIDLHPPGRNDPEGIHCALWAEIEDASYTMPPDKKLTLAAYSAGTVTTAYVEPISVGSTLPDMPLFLEPNGYVNVPLEETYLAAWRGVPERWRRVIEGT